MNLTLISLLFCSCLTACLCGALIHHFRKSYPFSRGTTYLLIGISAILGFLLGFFQEDSGSISSYLEILVIGPLLFLCATDLKAMELPDGANLVVGLLGFCHLLVAPFPFLSGIASGLILFFSFFLIALISGGALGGGDIKYVLAFGLWIPTSLILPFLLFSTLSASVYGIILLILSRKKEPLPFGPFLVLSSVYLLFLF